MMINNVEYFRAVKKNFETITQERTPKIGIAKPGADPILIQSELDIPKTLLTETQLKAMSKIEQDTNRIANRIKRNSGGHDKAEIDIFESFLNLKRYKNRLNERLKQVNIVSGKYKEAIKAIEELVGKIVSKFEGTSTVTYLRRRIDEETSTKVVRRPTDINSWEI